MSRNQNQPPAGHPEIEFTPRCTQVKPVDRSNGYNAWIITLEDGTEYQLTGLPVTFDVPGVGVHDAYNEMASAGLCSIDGHDMPLRKVDDSAEQENSQLLAPPSFGGNNQQPITVEEVPIRPVLEPPAYGSSGGQQVEQGDATTVLAILAFGGGAALIRHLAQRDRASQLKETITYNHQDLEEEIYYAEQQESPDVSTRPVHVSERVGVPSPWAGVHTGTLISQGLQPEIRPETERKYPGNNVETARKQGGNIFTQAETGRKYVGNISSPPETERKFSQSFQTFPGNRAEITPEMLDELRNEFDSRFQVDEGTPDNQDVAKGGYEIDVNNIDAQVLYESLRDQGVSNARTLGWAIFGVNGGRNWSTVSQILSTWNSEYES